jgi:hypothetical protein
MSGIGASSRAGQALRRRPDQWQAPLAASVNDSPATGTNVEAQSFASSSNRMTPTAVLSRTRLLSSGVRNA